MYHIWKDLNSPDVYPYFQRKFGDSFAGVLIYSLILLLGTNIFMGIVIFMDPGIIPKQVQEAFKVFELQLR